MILLLLLQQFCIFNNDDKAPHCLYALSLLVGTVCCRLFVCVCTYVCCAAMHSGLWEKNNLCDRTMDLNHVQKLALKLCRSWCLRELVKRHGWWRLAGPRGTHRLNPNVRTLPHLQAHGLYRHVPGKSGSASGCPNLQFILSTRGLNQTFYRRPKRQLGVQTSADFIDLTAHSSLQYGHDVAFFFSE